MNWLLKVLRWFGIKLAIGPVKLGAHVFMPLFYVNADGGADATWNYLSKSAAQKAYLRRHIKDNARRDETPAITFILTPNAESGGLIDDKMLAVTDERLAYLEAECKELVKDGIAVFVCLYVDDKPPRWFEIDRHTSVWVRVNSRVGKYLTGVILSIETNEEATYLGFIENKIDIMRSLFPKVAWHGTHLQFKTRDRYYSWTGQNVPMNANIILVETRNDPRHGDAFGVNGVQKDYSEIKAALPALKFVMHEFNIAAGGAVFEAQRAKLRELGAFGVG